MSAYEEFADLFMGTLAGEMSGLSRDQFLDLMKQRFPDESAFVRHMQDLQAVAQAQISQATAKLKPGQELAVGYSVDQPVGPTH